MAAYWDLLSMKFDENEDYEINWVNDEEVNLKLKSLSAILKF